MLCAVLLRWSEALLLRWMDTTAQDCLHVGKDNTAALGVSWVEFLLPKKLNCSTVCIEIVELTVMFDQ